MQPLPGLSRLSCSSPTLLRLALLALLLLSNKKLHAQEGFVPLGSQPAPLSQSQIDSILRAQSGPGAALPSWSRFLPGPQMAGLPAGMGFGLGWLGAFAGGIPKNPAGPTDLSALLKLLQGGGFPGGNPDLFKKMMEGFKPGANGVMGLSPMEMGQWVQLFGGLAGNKDLLAKLHPDLDWSKISPLLEKLNLQRAAGIDGKDLLLLKGLLERLTKPGAATPFGLQDLGPMMGLLDRINTGGAGFPGTGGLPGSFQSGKATLESFGITPENLGRFTDFLKRMGLDASQIEQLSKILSKIPAPGMNGDLGHWLAKFEWDKLSPGKWQGFFPKWSINWFERIKPNFAFLKGLRLPSFNLRPPSVSLPNIGSLSVPSFAWPDRKTLIGCAVAIGALVLLVWGYILLVKAGFAPDIKRVLGIRQHAENTDPVERFRLVYEGFALELLGLRAISFHHRRLADGLLGTFPGRQGQISYLGELYERARYLPNTLRPTPEQAQEGLMAISQLVREFENKPATTKWWRS